MKIFVTGSRGLVGSHFAQALDTKDEFTVLAPSVSELNIVDREAVEKFFSDEKLDIIVHFAAYTNVSTAEKERGDKNGLVWQTNVEGTANLVSESKKNNCYFIQISTDFVFAGAKSDPGPYHENHPPARNPEAISWYGWTKARAEQVVSDATGNFAIVRIANPVRKNYNEKLDYVHKIINAVDNHKELSLFYDQFLTLTYIPDVSKVLLLLVERRLQGFFHVTSANSFTPYDLGRYVLSKFRGSTNNIRKSSIKSFLALASGNRYPQYGGLSAIKTEEALKIKFMTWQQIVDKLADAELR